MSELMQACDRVLEMAGSRAETIVTATRGRSALTRFANSFIHQNVAEDTQRVSVKVVVDAGRAASASTTRTDDASLSALVEDVLAAAALRPPDPHWPGLSPPAAAPDVEHYDEATRDASPALRAGIVKSFVDAGPELQAAGYCSTGGTHLAFANSAGQRLEGRASTATVTGIHQSGGSDGSGRHTSVRAADLDGAAAGRRSAAKSRDGRDPVDIEPGAYEVILEPACVANMLQFLSSQGFNAKAHAEGTSFVTLGNRQMDEQVTIFDDVTDPRALGMPFDAEGTPRRRVELVTDGVSVGLVHSRRTAALAGTQSTGHAGPSEAFGATAQNLFFKTGDRSFEELVGSVERGLLVTEFNYVRILDPKTQVVTGLTRNGTFLIEGGEVKAPVRNLRFTQTYVGALGPGKVKGVSREGQLIGSSFVPALHLSTWNFTGGARG